MSEAKDIINKCSQILDLMDDIYSKLRFELKDELVVGKIQIQVIKRQYDLTQGNRDLH